MQWYLASKEIDVLSVDRGSRADMYYRFRVKYRVQGIRSEDMNSNLSAIRYEIRTTPGLVGKTKVLVSTLFSLARMLGPRPKGGQVFVYNQDLKTLTHIEDETVDAVVAVSSLEHNSPEGLREVVKELMRVLKPGGKLLATLGAARDKDWFHEPSKGWNYTEATMRDIFDLDPSAPSNYDQHDKLLAALKDCAELRDNLAGFYSRSGDNGMPWGKWDPQYIPIGVCKVKS
jgi:SAM-dependent methyltransferase